MNKLYKKSRGFTLIELLIVIAIIGILAAVLIPNLVSARVRAENAKRTASLKGFQAHALEQNNVGSVSYATIFSSGEAATKFNTFLASSSITAGQYSALSDATSYVAVLPFKNSTTEFWCVDSLGASKKVGSLITAGSGPYSCALAAAAVVGNAPVITLTGASIISHNGTTASSSSLVLYPSLPAYDTHYWSTLFLIGCDFVAPNTLGLWQLCSGVIPFNPFYVDLGYTATDVEDGNLTSNVTIVDTLSTGYNLAGYSGPGWCQYKRVTRTYTVTDSSNNVVSVSRTIVLDGAVPGPVFCN